MTAANNNTAGISFAGCDPMIPAPGPNTAPNNTGIPNVPNYFLCGGNEQNIGSIRVHRRFGRGDRRRLRDAFGADAADAGVGKYFTGGMPVTRLGDSSTTNNNNMVATQVAPSQTKCFVNA